MDAIARRGQKRQTIRERLHMVVVDPRPAVAIEDVPDVVVVRPVAVGYKKPDAVLLDRPAEGGIHVPQSLEPARRHIAATDEIVGEIARLEARRRIEQGGVASEL